MLLEANSLFKSYDGLKAVSDFSCCIEEGEIVGLIGPNGAGKSTLFNMLTGFAKSDSGTILFDDLNIYNKNPYKINLNGISRTFQDLRLIQQMTVLENVLLSFKDQPGENLVKVFFKNKTCRKFENDITARSFELLRFAGIENKAYDLAGDMSYGQQKLLSIVCCLASDPKLVMLDEPVSGIQPVMIDKITEMLIELARQGKTIFFIEHNIDFVMKVSDRVIVMDAGKKIAEGEPTVINDNKEILEAYLS